ncbi:MAG: BON domain-containing protein [Alphaproteobacteria bacterium]|nr:BON domain-containing protein [Alphaproteobacteria bacterium]MCY4496750.1 BON domain-containing protein [Rhodospirillaceae bacterium]
MTPRTSHRTLIVLLSLLVMSVLSACAGPVLLAGGAASAGIVAAQERSVGAAVDDTAIQLQIKHHLFQASEDLFNRVGSEVHEGRVLLTGVVPTPDDRVEAVRLAWQANGVQEVLNEIQVSDRDGIIDYFKDAKITAQLRFQMLRDRDVSDINFSVETVNGIVYLMGIARTGSELEKVTTYARNIAGVQKVISHVRLSGGRPREKS